MGEAGAFMHRLGVNKTTARSAPNPFPLNGGSKDGVKNLAQQFINPLHRRGFFYPLTAVPRTPLSVIIQPVIQTEKPNKKAPEWTPVFI